MNLQLNITCNTVSELLMLVKHFEKQCVEKSADTGVNMLELEFYETEHLGGTSFYGRTEVKLLGPSEPSTIPVVDKPGQLYVWNGIEGDLDEVSTIKEAKNYYKDYMEDGGIHPDIESIIILRQIGYIDIQETGETALTHDGEQEVCKIKIVISEPEMSFPSDQKLKQELEWWKKEESIKCELIIELRNKLTASATNCKVISEAVELLRSLADIQNGPPLVQYEKQWNQIMEDVYSFLKEYEPKTNSLIQQDNQEIN